MIISNTNSKGILRLTLCTITIAFCSLSTNVLLFGQDAIGEVKDALKSGNYPWFDATNDELKPVELPSAKEAASKDRNDLSTFVPKTRTGRARSRTDLSALSILAWVLIGLVIATIVGLLVWAFFKMENRERSTSEESVTETRTREARIKELPFELQKTKGDFRDSAHAAYQAGDYRTAMTFLFSHVLLILDKSSLIRLRKGKTNRQYLAELRTHTHLSDYYESVMVPFEDVFFGDYEIKQDAFEHCWDNLDSFQTQVNQTSQVAEKR